MFNQRHALFWMFAAVFLYACWSALDSDAYIRSLKAGNGPLYILASPLAGLAGYLAWSNRQKLLANPPFRRLGPLLAGHYQPTPAVGQPNALPIRGARSPAPVTGHIGLARFVRMPRPSRRQVIFSMIWLCVGVGCVAVVLALQPFIDMGTKGHAIPPHEHERLAIAAVQFCVLSAAVAFGVSVATLVGARKWSVPVTLAIVAVVIGILLTV